jgi:hypothetical protein
MRIETLLASASVELLGYIDPGVVSLAIQSFFVLIFSVSVGYLLGPWRWIVSFFRRKDESSKK